MSIKKLIELTIDHEFYKNGQCSCFNIITDIPTSQFINKNEMIVRKERNTWNLYSVKEKDSALWMCGDVDNKNIILGMKIKSSDDSFYKSINNSDSEDGINCLCNKFNEQVLEAVSCKDKQCKMWRKNYPVFSNMEWCLNLEFSPEEFSDKEKKITIKFKSKNVLWKYLVCSDNETGSMEIIDSESIVKFERNGTEPLPDGLNADTFISNVKIPLKADDLHQFRLVVNKNGAVKSIVKRLPVANVNGIRYHENSKDDLVSLIFIHI